MYQDKIKNTTSLAYKIEVKVKKKKLKTMLKDGRDEKKWGKKWYDICTVVKKQKKFLAHLYVNQDHMMQEVKGQRQG